MNVLNWLSRYDFGEPEGPALQLIAYCTPVSQGRSRFFYCLPADRSTTPEAMKKLFDLMPSWLKFVSHFGRNDVLDSDAVFLHGQVRIAAPDTYALHARSLCIRRRQCSKLYCDHIV